MEMTSSRGQGVLEPKQALPEAARRQSWEIPSWCRLDTRKVQGCDLLPRCQPRGRGGVPGDTEWVTLAYRVIPEALEAGWRFETAYNPTCSGGDVIRVLRDRSSDWAGRGVAARGWAGIQGRAVITPPFALRKYFFFSSATPYPRPGRCCRINEWLECLWPETMQQRSMHNGKEFFKWSGPRGGAQRAGDLK